MADACPKPTHNPCCRAALPIPSPLPFFLLANLHQRAAPHASQAVYGWSKKEVYVILHAHRPCTGIASFRDWLKVSRAA